ncbi:MAG: hypothetical protein CMP20_15480 [Rickettsiales bacterium]|nr:hypothetical protein [Rickettsiales bacterium]
MDTLKQTLPTETPRIQSQLLQEHTDLSYTLDQLAALVDSPLTGVSLITLIARAPPGDATLLFQAFRTHRRDDCRKTIMGNIDSLMFYTLARELSFDREAVRKHYVDNGSDDLVRWLDNTSLD